MYKLVGRKNWTRAKIKKFVPIIISCLSRKSGDKKYKTAVIKRKSKPKNLNEMGSTIKPKLVSITGKNVRKNRPVKLHTVPISNFISWSFL